MNAVCFKTTENEKEKNQKALSFFMELLKGVDSLM